MHKIRTHLAASKKWVGNALEISAKKASAELILLDEMRVDDSGLTHGSFTFGLADYAAMLAVNEATVVLASAQSDFLWPTKVGETLLAQAEVTSEKGRKRFVKVEVYCNVKKVFSGEFICVVLDKHVLD